MRILLHGDSDGSNYVAIRRSGSCSVSGRMGSDPRDLAYEYSKKLYNGTAAADVDCRTVGAQGVPYPVPGRNGAGIRSGPADIIPYDVGRAFIL